MTGHIIPNQLGEHFQCVPGSYMTVTSVFPLLPNQNSSLSSVSAEIGEKGRNLKPCYPKSEP